MSERALVDAGQIAELTGVRIETVYQMGRQGRLPEVVCRLPGRAGRWRFMYDLDDVLGAIEGGLGASWLLVGRLKVSEFDNLDLLHVTGPLTSQDLAERRGVKIDSAEHVLRALCRRGLAWRHSYTHAASGGMKHVYDVDERPWWQYREGRLRQGYGTSLTRYALTDHGYTLYEEALDELEYRASVRDRIVEEARGYAQERSEGRQEAYC